MGIVCNTFLHIRSKDQSRGCPHSMQVPELRSSCKHVRCFQSCFMLPADPPGVFVVGSLYWHSCSLGGRWSMGRRMRTPRTCLPLILCLLVSVCPPVCVSLLMCEFKVFH